MLRVMGEWHMRRRRFLKLLGGAASWPLVAHAQAAIPVVGLVSGGSADTSARFVAAFRKGLGETGYVENQNVTVEYHWLEGQQEGLPALMADLVRRRVAVIVTPTFTPAALAAKAATATIPIVFGVSEGPVRLGLAASLSRPGGNATGINILNQEVTTKRLRLLHDLVPKAVRMGLLVNPANVSITEVMIRDVKEGAASFRLQIQILNATTVDEIDAAFASFARERPDALLVAPDSFFTSRRAQFAALTAKEKMPASYAVRELVEAGGLMSYGTDLGDAFRQVGSYTGQILKGTKPAELPVVQSTKFEFVLNLKIAQQLDIEVPPAMLATADDVIE
jgi:putative ABC transport system substrate-binding protein